MSVLDRFRLDGKIALITAGAGPLFGSSCTAGLAEAGATVITASRSREHNEKHAEGLRARGFKAYGLQVDMTKPESIERLQREAKECVGDVDILVNNAVARPAGMSTIEEVTLESLTINAQSDMIGLIWMCKAFCPGMAERGRGSVINIASTYGSVGADPTLYPGTGIKPPIVYPFIKGGMVNLTRALASYYGKRGVRVNCLSPGGYNPSGPQLFAERYAERCPLGRMMDGQDIQGAIVFLASDASSYVTGANLSVDGGWTAI